MLRNCLFFLLLLFHQLPVQHRSGSIWYRQGACPASRGLFILCSGLGTSCGFLTGCPHTVQQPQCPWLETEHTCLTASGSGSLPGCSHIGSWLEKNRLQAYKRGCWQQQALSCWPEHLVTLCSIGVLVCWKLLLVRPESKKRECQRRVSDKQASHWHLVP